MKPENFQKDNKKIAEGKTKVIWPVLNHPEYVYIESKNRITANNALRSNDMEGKALLSNETNCQVFDLLKKLGIPTHMVQKVNDTSFVARNCHMIPIEWVTRRVATGSFLKRHPGVPEGFTFYPVKMETFFKDDANADPQWGMEQILASDLFDKAIHLHDVSLSSGDGAQILKDQQKLLRNTTYYNVMAKLSVVVFEVLERVWAKCLNCALIDMKVEFGIDATTGDLLLADVIDNDSWRLWPKGDKRLMVDKQVYRDLKEVTPEDLEVVKRNFSWVVQQLKSLDTIARKVTVVIMMGSASDMPYAEQISSVIGTFQVNVHLHIASAHKGTEEVLRIASKYEASHDPLVFIAIAGGSNGLGPVLAGNVAAPVINCPPIDVGKNELDIWSSLRVPSGLGCTTVMSPQSAALAALTILGQDDAFIWSQLKARQAITAIKLMMDDGRLQKMGKGNKA